MADSKITALASIGTGTDPANDPLVIVDVSDILPGGMSLTGTTKKVTLNNLLACSPTATLASATITGDLTVKTNLLKVDSTNNRVLAGLTSGSDVLSAKDTLGVVASSTTADLNFRNSGLSAIQRIRYTDGTGVLTIGSATVISYPIELGGNTTTRAATIDSSGNLGLGVTPSAWINTFKAFQIADSGSYITSYPANQTINQYLYIGNNAFYDSVDSRWEYIRSKPSAQYLQYNNQHQWFYDSGTQTAGAACTFVQAMTLDASGNLLVGTTSAYTKLTVNGELSIGGASGGFGVNFHSGSPASGNRAWLLANDSANSNTLNLYYYNAGVFSGRALNVDQSGNFMVRTPTTPPTIPDNGMMVFNLTSNTNLRISVKGTDGTTRTANITLA